MALLREIESEEQQEEVLALLKFALDKYEDDVLTSDEVRIAKKAFDLVAWHSNTVAISLPSWLVMPFEFSGTFGLSRWGNDLFVPDHSDKTRFITEATTWSELNHPHVAKFLGACHVGDHPFIVHEKVQTLAEYVNEKKDRQQAWKRLYEVALALQYPHERGLGCGNLSLEYVYCAQFDAKAMLLGVGLVGNGNGVLNQPDEDPRGERESSRLSLVASDIGALHLLSLDCMREIVPPSFDEPSPTEQEGIDTSDEADQTLSPTIRPAFVEETEWEALMEIRRVDGASPGAILQVIERLKALAGIAGQQDWLGDSLMLNDALETAGGVGAIVVPSLGKSVAEILSRCAEMALTEDPETHIQSRLADIYSQIAAIDLLEANAPSLKELISHFAALLVRLYRLLEQKTSIDAFSRAVLQERVPVSMVSFHSDIDRLLESYNLSSTSDEHTWKPKWELLSSRHQFVALSTLIRHPSPQLPIVQEEEEAKSLTFDQAGSRTLAAHRYGRKMLSDLRGRIGGAEAGALRRAKLPRWFLPPTEVDFKSFAEFSRGAFGSVHLGKWFDTRVVVKRVFTDADERATVQAQFRREADVWFRLNHINVVKMYGACHLDQPFFVCEYASGGNLDSYLEREGRDPRLMWYSLLNAALGLQYLHDNGIVHADLKADNILVGADGVPKLTDFGLSVSARRRGADEVGGGAVGAYRWKAPECLPSKGTPGKAATFASDVHSFAMVMIEIVSGNYPWGGSMPDVAVVFHVKKGRLPPRPKALDDSEWRLIERMCCLDPTQRVTIDGVVVHLSALIERLDMAELWPTWEADELVVHKNRVVSRGGALLSLLELAKSTNERLVEFATEHLLSVIINRTVPADKREIDALIELLVCGSNAEKAWAAAALRDLSWGSARNRELIASAGGIPPLVTLLRDGNDEQKQNAVGTLRNLARNGDNRVLIASEGGIPVLMALLCDGSDGQKESAAGTLSNLAVNSDNKVLIASAGGILSLVALLSGGNDAQKNNAVKALRILARNGDNKILIASAGAIPELVALVRDGNDGQKENAAGALWTLAVNGDNKAPIASAGGIPPLLALLCDGNDAQKRNAAGALNSLSVNDDNQVLIASAGGIPVLVALVRDGNDFQKERAADSLWNLSFNDDNEAKIASAGGISVLVELARDGNDAQKENAVGALRNLSVNETGKATVVSAGSIPVLVALLRDGTDSRKENAAGVLQILARNGDNKTLIAAAGAIPALVALVRDGNDEQKDNAAGALINLSTTSDNKVLIASAGGVPALIALVRDGNDIQKERAAGALWNLSTNIDNKVLIASVGGVTPLVTLLCSGNDVQKKNAAGALNSLSVNDANKVLIASAGAIPVLVALVRDGNDFQKVKAADSLWNLSFNDNNEAQIASSGGISALVKLVRDGNDAQKEKVAGALQNLSVNEARRMLVVSAGGIPVLVALLRGSTDNLKAKAAVVLGNLALSSDNSSLIASAGSIPLLVAMVRGGNDAQKEDGAYALWKLSTNIDNKVLVTSAGGISPLVTLLRDGNDDQKGNAAAALRTLAVNGESKALIASAGGIPALIALVRDGNDIQKERATGALWNLSTNIDNKVLIASAGGIPPLVALVRDGNGVQTQNAAAALWNLAINGDNRVLIASAGGIPPLVAMMRDGNDVQKKNAAGALSSLAYNNDNKALIVSAGGISVLVALVRNGNDFHKKIAASTLWGLSEIEENETLIASAGGIASLLALVSDGNNDQKENAVGALTNLSVSSANKVLIADAGGTPVLVALVRDGNNNQMNYAACVLRNIAYKNASIASQIVRDGGVDALARLLVDGNGDQKVSAAGALGFLELDKRTKALIVESGGVAALLADIQDGDDDDDKELGLAALRNLCCDGDGAVRASLMAGNGAAILSEVVQSGNTRLVELASAILSDTTGQEVAGDIKAR